MSSKRKNNNKNRRNKNRQDDYLTQHINEMEKNENVSEEVDESDRIIAQLDKIETEIRKKSLEKVNTQDREEISSRVKNLIKSDKEAIREMQERMASLDDDDLDFLDDEKPEEEKTIDDNNINKVETESNKKHTKEDTATNSKSNKNSKKSSKKANSNNGSEKKTDDKKDKVVTEETDVNLDFFKNMERKEEIHYNKIRKQQPNRLRSNTNMSVKEFFMGNVRNMAIAITEIVLVIMMFVALIVTNSNGEDKKNYDFLKVDDTLFIETINKYYESLGSGNIDNIRDYIYEEKSLSDAEILKLTEEQTFLSEFFFSDILDDPFKITKCYVLEGMKKNEYIVLMKYQFTIRDCTEPATGIFTWYMIDVSKDDSPQYKISTDVGDRSSEIYRYVCKMENIDKVRELVDEVNDELVESCKKDEVLRTIIYNMYDEMIKSGDNIDDGFRNIILELKNYEKSLEEKSEEADDSTTQAPEAADTEEK